MFRGSGGRRKSKSVTTSSSKHILCCNGVNYSSAYVSSGGDADGDRLGLDGRGLVEMTVAACFGSLSCKKVHITEGRVFADDL